MTLATKKKLEYFPIIDQIIEEIGERIEGAYPFIELLEDKKEETPEYRLLNKIWVDWCDYLEN